MRKIWLDIKQSLGLELDLNGTPEVEVELAAAVLLMEMSLSDHSIDETERAAAIKSLARVFPDFEGDLDNLIAQAEVAADEGVSFHPHVEALNESLPYAKKVQVLESLWRVAFADGRVDKYEEHYLRRVCDLLHLPHKAFIMAKQAVAPQA